MKPLNILQWNLNGFFKKQNELKLIINNLNPQIICLQETNFKEDYTAPLKEYSGFSKNRITANRASGGTSIYVKSNIPVQETQIKSNLETIAITIELKEKFTICNIYLPNQTNVSLTDLEDISKQLPKPYIIVGDFNAHNILWGSNSTDYRGQLIEKLISSQNLILLNDTSPTHINLANGKFSNIDLSLSTPSISQRLEWKVLNEVYSSDHLPINIKLSTRQTDVKNNQVHRWNLKNPNWKLFTDLLEGESKIIGDMDLSNIDEATKKFTTHITSIAQKTIGSNANFKKPRVPWWNEKIKMAIKDKNNALNTFKKNNSQENFIKLKQLRAKAKYIINHSKKTSWNQFTNSINPQAKASEIWNKIKSLKGLSRGNEIILKNDHDTIVDPEEVANKLASFFQNNSSNNSYDKKFISEIKTPNEKQQIVSVINSSNPDQYNINLPITMNEIEQTLNKCNSKSPGPDGIPYSFLQNLGTKSKESLLRIYNNIWSTGIIPREWKRGTVIPLPKPGKNKYTTEGYRPITLLNTMAKILEKIINNRLIWFLEKNKHISNKQSGFRRSRSTLDNLVTIHSEINKTFATNQYLGMICLDITKAYDTIWRHRVIHILSKIISNGNMLQYIKSFLDNRQFAVKVSNTLSANLLQENGVPQGSSLSVTLFLLAINNIMENIKYPVNAMLFADDFNFWCRSNNLSTVQRFLEETANKLTQWANTSGFKFSNSKSQCIIFSKKRGPKHINVQIDGKNIPNNNTVKILGLKFDTKMNWIQHLKYLKTDINQRLNLIKVLSHTQWGGDEHSLIRIHRQLIRAKLDYGAILYQSTSHSHLKIIDSTLNSSIRLCIGAFKSSPIESIRNIAQEAPPELRRAEKTLLYAASITRNTDNPANKHIVETIQTANEDKIQLGSILKVNPYSFPPWTFKLEINMELAQNKKENTNPIIYQEHLRKVLEIYQNCNMFFTDASKTEKGVGIAIVHHETTIKYRLPKECSIFSAEAIAVFKTIEFIQIQDKMSTNNLILTDSLSTLRSLENNTNPTDIAKNIQEKTYDLKLRGINIIFIWVPGHTNIRGNETADQAAKEAAQPNNLNIQFLDTVTYDDIKTHIKNKSLTKWQTHWSKQQTKLNEIKNTIFNWQNPNLSRKEKILINRLRIGHTRLTHQHLMAKKEPTQCIVCGVTLTVKHIITECYQYAEHLKKYNIPPNLYEALGPDSENTSNMLTFLKKSDLYDKI